MSTANSAAVTRAKVVGKAAVDSPDSTVWLSKNVLKA